MEDLLSVEKVDAANPEKPTRGAEVYRLHGAHPHDPQDDIVISNYNGESEIQDIMDIMTLSLSEPYSIYTYRHFLEGWAEYALVAHAGTRLVGAMVCKTELRRGRMRGYIGMLAVATDLRRAGLGRTMASLAIQRLAVTCDEIVLETESDNVAALSLYEGMGFIRDKKMEAYYLNGKAAYRLKLWFR